MKKDPSLEFICWVIPQVTWFLCKYIGYNVVSLNIIAVAEWLL